MAKTETTQTVHIEDLKRSDLNEFHELFQSLVNNDFSDFNPELKRFYLKQEYSKRNFRIWIDKKLKKLLIAKDENGRVLGIFVGNVPFGGIGIVGWLGVKASARGRRVGQRLLQVYEDYCVDNDCHKIELWTKNVDYYARFGYKFLVEKVTYFGLHRAYMEKELGEWQGIYKHPVYRLGMFRKVQIKVRSFTGF